MGGGSYGHYWSVEYDMHTKPAKTNPKGVAIVKNSMVELNKIILDSAVKNGINSYCLPPTDFMNGNKSIKSKILIINDIAKSGLTPITFGDALWFGGGKILHIIRRYDNDYNCKNSKTKTFTFCT